MISISGSKNIYMVMSEIKGYDPDGSIKTIDEVRGHINRFYGNYKRIAFNSMNCKKSVIFGNRDDILHDVLLEVLSMDPDILIKKINTPSYHRSKNGLNSDLDGFIIYLIQLNMRSLTSRHFKKYSSPRTGLEPMGDRIYDYLDEYDSGDGSVYKIEEIDEITNDKIITDYEYHRGLFRARYKLDSERPGVISYERLSSMFNIPASSIRATIKEFTAAVKSVVDDDEKKTVNMNKLNYNHELRKFRDTMKNDRGVEMSYGDAQSEFKPIWEKMKKSYHSTVSGDEDTLRSMYGEERRWQDHWEWYTKNLRGKSIIPKELKSQFAERYHDLLKIKPRDLNCPGCLTRQIRQYVKKLENHAKEIR